MQCATLVPAPTVPVGQSIIPQIDKSKSKSSSISSKSPTDDSIPKNFVLTLFPTTDHDHTVQTNPTFYVQSATNPNSSNDEWVSFTHDQTDGIIKTGSGDLELGEKTKFTRIGGLAIQLTNKTGVDTVAGQLVQADTSANDAVKLTGIDEEECFGVFLDSGIAANAEAWVVISGIADVAMEDNTTATRGNWVRSSITEAGYADATNAAPPSPAAFSHFNEIGNCIETVTTGGIGTHILARCVLHFN